MKISKITQGGTLEARRILTGITLAWRVTINGMTHRYPIGIWDSSAPPKSLSKTNKGYSIAAALAAADVMAALHIEHIHNGGYPKWLSERELARELADREQTHKQEEAEKAKRAMDQFNLVALLSDYCEYLSAIGRRSHGDALSIFKNHVFEAWPQVAALPAKDITPDQVSDMMRKVIEAGKGRTANKLRSYMRAAYQVAKASRSKPSIPVKFKAYDITINPVADTLPDEGANKADKNPLSAEELRTYWGNIKPMPGFIGAVLRLHLLTGGQRIEQLANLLTANVLPDSLILFDGKGRPGKAARPHQVPLIPAASLAMKQCNPVGAYALSTDGGKTHVSATTLSNWSCAAAHGIDDFQTKRIRSGVETLLASARISTDIRGRLQSHGISGVQNRHYDGHEYMDEKREALETLFYLLEGNAIHNNVVQLKVAK